MGTASRRPDARTQDSKRAGCLQAVYLSISGWLILTFFPSFYTPHVFGGFEAFDEERLPPLHQRWQR